MSDAADILRHLMTTTPQRTEDAPTNSRGVYGLVDHEGRLSYIGSTASADENFRKRIHQRHRTGSETYSHYFAKVYNTGRMWRDRRTQQNDPDAKIAKAFRNDFIAEYCRAVWYPLPDDVALIFKLEAAVIRLAPLDVRRWNANTDLLYPEPVELVDALMAMRFTQGSERAAMERQRARFQATGQRAWRA